MESDRSSSRPMKIEVDTKLYLLSPRGVGIPPEVIQVNLANSLCLVQKWKRSKQFDYSSSIQTDDCVADKARLGDLQRELDGVISWFKLGVELKIPTDKLLTIRADNNNKVDECKMEMLIRWSRQEICTWTKVIRALVNIGRRDIAEKLGKKYGLSVPTGSLERTVSSEHYPSAVDVMNCRQMVSRLEDRIKRDAESIDVDTKAVKRDEDTTVPKLRMKISGLTEEVHCLSLELEHKIKENAMLKEAKSKLEKEWCATIEDTERKNHVKIMMLTDSLRKTKDELELTEEKLTDKQKKLYEKRQELARKTTQLVNLKSELEEMTRKFKHLQEQMDQRLVNTCDSSSSATEFHERTRVYKETQNQVSQSTPADVQSAITMQEPENPVRKGVALYTYTGRSENELSFNKGDTLLLSEMATTDQEHWWYGTKSDGSQGGYIPVAYVELQTESLLASVCQQDPYDQDNTTLRLAVATNAPCVLARCGCDATFDGDRTLYMRPGGTLDIFAYNTISGLWTQLPSCPTRFCSIAVVNKVLTTIGGELNSESTDKVFSLVKDGTCKTLRWIEIIPPLPSKQTRTRTVSYNGTYLIVAGKDSKTVELLNLNSLRWSTVGNLPKISDLRTLVLKGNHLYSIHDNDSMYKCSVCDIIENKVAKWSEVQCTGIIYGSTYVTVCNELLSVGGRSETGEPTTAIRMYSPDTNTWEVIGHTNTPRMFCFAGAFDSHSFLIAGGFTSYSASSNNKTSKVEIASFTII